MHQKTELKVEKLTDEPNGYIIKAYVNNKCVVDIFIRNDERLGDAVTLAKVEWLMELRLQGEI